MSGHLLILAVSVLVAFSAVLSALGFRGRVEVVGVDLGTTYSVAAVSEGGRVRVFDDSVRGKLTASTVAFLRGGGARPASRFRLARRTANLARAAPPRPRSRLVPRSSGLAATPRRHGSFPRSSGLAAPPRSRQESASGLSKRRRGIAGVLVGEAARKHAIEDPKHVIYDAKRFIGRKFDDPTVAEQARKYAFNVVPNGTEVAFALDVEGHPPMVTPEAVGAEVVKALVKTVAEDLGHENVKRAVIAVPASFGPAQMAATGEAFKAAGLRVARIMPEPVAAAVAYGLHKKPDVNHVRGARVFFRGSRRSRRGSFAEARRGAAAGAARMFRGGRAFDFRPAGSSTRRSRSGPRL